MFAARALSRSSRSITSPCSYNRPTLFKPSNIVRRIACSTKFHQEDNRTGANGPHEGTFARTKNTIQVEYPDDLPKSAPVQGRGANKRTLASFSLEGRVGVVTGGARGLGLVMSQALVVSGASVAIVDLNREFRSKQNNLRLKEGRLN